MPRFASPAFAISLLTVFALSTTAACQPMGGVWQGDLIIATADDVAGAAGTEIVAGDLIVDDTSIASLAGLESITTIDGALVLGGDVGNRSLTTLTGLSGIQTVGEHVLIKRNPVLVDLGGLSALRTVSGSFSVTENGLLSTMGTVSSLASVGDFFSISENPSLTNLTGLPALLDVEFTLAIESNGSLTSIDGLSALRSAGRLFVRRNPALPTCLAIALRDKLLAVAGLARYDGLVDITDNADDGCEDDPP